jgi:hypothetical protein
MTNRVRGCKKYTNGYLTTRSLRAEWHLAQKLWGPLPTSARGVLKQLATMGMSISAGDLIWLADTWYATHSGLLRLANRMHCSSIHTQLQPDVSDPASARWVFKAVVRYSRKAFSGYGDANPLNVSPVVRGAEMRVAETRAVNRALRKAFGIGICSVEEIGYVESRHVRRMPPQSANGNGSYGGPKVRDRLCQLIRQHGLDAGLVKSYAIDFCGTKQLREASREQVEAFVAHLSDWAEKDRNALLCQLNSYLPVQTKKEGAA